MSSSPSFFKLGKKQKGKKMKDTKKSSRLRRQRGYSFEKEIVTKFQDHNWISQRLGSPSTHLPDVHAVNSTTIVAVEAKSTTGNLAYVPMDQIERCKDWVYSFDLYNTKKVVLGFKFPSTTTRKLRYFYKVFPFESLEPLDVKCSYEGVMFAKYSGNRITMKDFKFD